MKLFCDFKKSPLRSSVTLTLICHCHLWRMIKGRERQKARNEKKRSEQTERETKEDIR